MGQPDDGSEVGAEFDEREPLMPPHDEAWAGQRFPDRGPAPSNEVKVDPAAGDSPNVERPCEGEVTDDD
jgi:hypothetical protein